MRKTLLLPLLAFTLAAALPLAAQAGPAGPAGPPPPSAGGIPGGPGAGPGGPPPDVVLREILGLTDDQLSAVQALQETRRQTAQPLVQQMGDAQKALGDALKAASPDPAAVGSALLVVESLRKQLGAVDEAFRTGFAALLTADQKARVDSIRSVAAAVRAADALRGLGVL